SIKQGRVIMKLPRPGVFVAAVKDLFDFHGLDAPFDFDTFAEKLRALTDKLLRDSHAKRARPGFDRRRK
ncbi:MAG TPA: hypothetical protein VLJ84_02560, partial [Usitatibacter sp.]|nr:hypothetical protein [Usitatibacter sp.]